VLSFRITVTLGEAKVDYVDVVFGALCAANQKVVGLNVSMDYSFFMNFLDSLDQLNSYHQTRLQIERSLASLEKVF